MRLTPKRLPAEDHNPFKIQHPITFKTNRRVGESLVSPEGELIGSVKSNKRGDKHDGEVYVKFFKRESKELRKLNPAAIAILAYIIEVLKPNVEIVVLKTDELLRFVELKEKSISSLYRGINCLSEADFIRRVKGSPEHYFINANRFFNGNRVKFMERDQMPAAVRFEKHQKPDQP